MAELTIDLRMFNSSGIGTYLKNLIPLIINDNPKIFFNLLGNPDDLEGFLTFSGNTKIINFPSKIYSIKEQIQFLKIVPKTTDLLWCPHFNIPLFKKTKLLVTIHDLLHLARPDFFKNYLKILFVKTFFKKIARNADHIIFPSVFSKSEFQKNFGFKFKNLTVIHSGVDESFFQFKEEKFCQRPVTYPYILFIGNIKPHKNLYNLVKGFSLIQERIPHKLIIIGQKEGLNTQDSHVKYYKKLLKDKIVFTGMVNDHSLKCYLNFADLFIFPSLYEGFGLPPLEAMASNCPVLASKIPPIVEICKDGVFYFDPTDPFDISNKILKALTEPKMVSKLTKRGKEIALDFTWKKTAAATSQIIRSMVF